jgi:enoyl-CoA hydratase
MSDAVLYEVKDNIGLITLNRPERLNAWNGDMASGYFNSLDAAAADPDVRVIVVTGAGGKAFSAGADIREFTAPQVPTVFREARRRLNFRAAMGRCWQPIIAAIGGHCFGGGLELALACDIRIASADSRLGPPRSTSRSSPAAAAPSGCPAWSAAARRWR